MNTASISGTSHGLVYPAVEGEYNKAAHATQDANVKSTVVKALQVAGSQSRGKVGSTGILVKIGQALKDVANTVQRIGKQVNGEIDALAKKSPILSFALGLTAGALGMGLLTAGVLPAAPLALAGFVLLYKALDPFSNKMTQLITDMTKTPKPVQADSQPLVQNADNSFSQAGYTKKPD